MNVYTYHFGGASTSRPLGVGRWEGPQPLGIQRVQRDSDGVGTATTVYPHYIHGNYNHGGGNYNAPQLGLDDVQIVF